MAVFSSTRRALTPNIGIATSSGSCVLAACESDMSNSPLWLALACVAAEKSKARSTDAINSARFRCSLSKAPPLISASTVRLFSLLRSTRTQKS